MIDAHIHLQDKRFDADRDDLIRQAENKGVNGFFLRLDTPAGRPKRHRTGTKTCPHYSLYRNAPVVFR